MAMGPKPKPLAERFWKYVHKTDGCWNWTGDMRWDGYGRIWYNSPKDFPGKTHATHKVAWFLETGHWPVQPEQVLHRCDNPACVRFDHLFLGTTQDNKADSVAKKRHATGDRVGTKNRGETHHAAKHTNETVALVRLLRAAGTPIKELESRFKMSSGYISDLCNNKIRRVKTVGAPSPLEGERT